ncbi:unnamed protein product [Trichobilharzia regenti]|nr:unnamed protein product [Trichobilharzia regenti]
MCSNTRPRYAARLPDKKDPAASDDEESLREEVLFDADMRAQLLSNTERIARSTTKLEDGVRIALETEDVGGHILQDLSEQREKLQRSRDRVSFLFYIFMQFQCTLITPLAQTFFFVYSSPTTNYTFELIE